MGGTRSASSSLAANCLAVCRECHEWIENNRDQAKELGLLVIQSHDPEAVPVLLRDGYRLLFEAVGYRVSLVDGRWLADGVLCPSWANPTYEQGQIDITEALEAHRLRRAA